jgi:zinc protease
VTIASLAGCASRPSLPPGREAPAAPTGAAQAKPEPPAPAERPTEAARAAAPKAQGPASLPAAPEARAGGAKVAAARLSPAKERVGYLEAALSDYWLEKLPNGATVAVKRQAGRKTAAARIVLGRAPVKPGEAGFDALALSATVRAAERAASSAAAGPAELAAFKSGASMELKIEDYDDVAVEILCPAAGAAPMLDLVAAALASPAFAQEDFDRALREARIAERRDSGDPLVRAAAELRASLYRLHPYGIPPRGTPASLASATRESVMRYWSSSFSPQRLFIVVVGDFEPGPFASRVASSFGRIGGANKGSLSGGAQGTPDLPIRPWFKALSLAATPGSAVLRGEYGAPESSSPDYPAMTVALAMLDDLLLEGMRGGDAGGASGIAYGAWAKLSAAAAPSASVTVYKTSDPAAAKSAVDQAIKLLCSGLCLDASSPSGELGPVSRSLEAYKSRSVTTAYARGASSAGMAARIARDLASGGDGTAFFRMADRIQAVGSEDVLRVARQRLLDGPAAWVALGDPNLVLGLPLSAFVPSH